MGMRIWASDAADLMLGRACLACQAPGPSLCPGCLSAALQRPAPEPERLGHPDAAVTLDYALPYRGLGSALVLAFKEHGDRSLRAPLAHLLASAVTRALEDAGAHDHSPAALLPIPRHSRSRRGFDALGLILDDTRRALRERRIETAIVPALVHRRDHAPLKTLGRMERWRTVRHSMGVDVRASDRLPSGPLLLVDDVVTTGATLLEAARALRSAGIPVARAVSLSHQQVRR